MPYMVVERYLSGPGLVYERAAACGRMLPEGLVYVNSWVVDDGGMDRCFQLMETSDPALLDVWFERWIAPGQLRGVPRDHLRRGGGPDRDMTGPASPTAPPSPMARVTA